jgi:FkbM family methyltransferase
MSSRLTVIIPCKNESEHLRACIQSAQAVADEVLVADSGSTDGSKEIALDLGCRIIEREYRTSGDFKNWAIPQAAHDWVLILDADERITPALANEIRVTLANPHHDGYWIYRLNYFLGHPIRYGFWKNDRCLRLFRRDLGRYIGPTDHAEVELTRGTVGALRQCMTHYSCASYDQYLPKLSRYADVQSRVWHAKRRRSSWAQLLFRFPLRFIQGYILRLGFLDGLAGLQVCLLVAYLSYLKHAYLWQLQNTRHWREIERADRPRNQREQTTSAETIELAISPSDTIRAIGDERAKDNSNTSQPCEIQPAPSGFRAWRRRWTPAWLQTDARRRWRDIAFRRFGIQRCHVPPIVIRQPALAVRSCLPFVLGNALLDNPHLTFMQIGAFDGHVDDDLQSIVKARRFRGVLLEPQPAAFARLQRTYRDQPQVTLLQAAIADQLGTRTLYCKRGEASMVASFDREHLRKHNVPDSEIVEQSVTCHTVESAMRAAGLARIDVLQIDAEGYDWPIIRSIDFSRLRPRVLRFEYRHMSTSDADECLKLLADHGYQFVIESRDIIAHLEQSPPLVHSPPGHRASA